MRSGQLNYKLSNTIALNIIGKFTTLIYIFITQKYIGIYRTQNKKM